MKKYLLALLIGLALLSVTSGFGCAPDKPSFSEDEVIAYAWHYVPNDLPPYSHKKADLQRVSMSAMYIKEIGSWSVQISGIIKNKPFTEYEESLPFNETKRWIKDINVDNLELHVLVEEYQTELVVTAIGKFDE